MGITVEFIVGCIGVLIGGATTMELATSKVLVLLGASVLVSLSANFTLRAEKGAVTAKTNVGATIWWPQHHNF